LLPWYTESDADELAGQATTGSVAPPGPRRNPTTSSAVPSPLTCPYLACTADELMNLGDRRLDGWPSCTKWGLPNST
jgi:hypothetical protein